MNGITSAGASRSRLMRSGSLLAVAAIVITLVATSTSGATTKNGSNTASVANHGVSTRLKKASVDAVQTAATAALHKWIVGSQGALPKTGPKAVKHKSVWVISCGQVAPACAYSAASTMAAGRAIGWKMTLYDTKLNPVNGNIGISDALAAHANGIVEFGNDCPAQEQGLKEARSAKVPVVGIDGEDCNSSVEGGTGPKLFVPLEYSPKNPTVTGFLRSQGTLQADYLLANLGSKADVIQFQITDLLSGLLVNQGFTSEYKRLCPACTLDTIDYTLNDLIDGTLKTDAQNALVSNPGANGIEVDVDSQVSLVIGPVRDAEGKSSVLLVGAEGLSANIAAALKGQWQDAGSGEPLAWEAWAAIDELNRTFAHSRLVNSGVGIRLWSVYPTKVNLPPAGQNYQPGVNFEGNYKRIWRVR